MARQIIMDVPRDGISTGKASPQFETQGFEGATCQAASEFLSNALGRVTEDVPTGELYTDNRVERINDT